MAIDLSKKRDRNLAPRLQQKFDQFLQSLGDSLADSAALEVNTMVVERITGERFIPWQAYQDIYALSKAELDRLEIHPSLYPRYLNLRKSLEIEYCLLLLETEISAAEAAAISAYIKMLGDESQVIDLSQTKLPNPLAAEIGKIQDLLHSGRFLSRLRQLSELKNALDSLNLSLHQGESNGAIADTICAQSTIYLNGKIVNRYDRKLFESADKDLILAIHQQGVAAGEKQWHNLLEFVVNLVESLVNKRFSFRNFFKIRNL